MVIKPKTRGFICTNAHPVGCHKNVSEQVEFIKQANISTRNLTENSTAPNNVLVIGASTGYGLASRITAAYGYGASTIGVFFEKPPTEKRTASAGYYNAAAFDSIAKQDGLYAKSLNGDAFSNVMKEAVTDLIQQDFINSDKGQIDLVVYSLASPRRTDPNTGVTYSSVISPVGEPYTAKNLNVDNQVVGEITVQPASQEEIDNTVKVMGGEDWHLWIEALSNANVLAPGCKTVAYTYIGDELTKPIYGRATIGKAKEHLDETATLLNAQYDIQANVSVLKAVVTQASSAIPVMPLYMSILFKEMIAEGTHEGCIEQLARLFDECLYSDQPRMDDQQRFRVDELELNSAMQAKVAAIWPQVTTENLHQLTDFNTYRAEFLRLFGFGIEGVDYDADVNPIVTADF